MNPAPILSLNKVHFSWPESAVMSFNFECDAGRRIALIGASGSGKSTCLALIAGFLLPQSGTILAEGHDITNLQPANRPLSIVFQENNLFAHLSVFENVALGRTPSLRLTEQDQEDVITALRDIGLYGKETRMPDQLSGGERQRVALARVLVRKKPIVLLDEPFSSLGPGLRRDMLALTLETQSNTGATMIMVTHDAEDALRFATDIAFVHGGSVNELITPQSLKNPAPGSALAHYLGKV